jgi:hypothetical protein
MSAMTSEPFYIGWGLTLLSSLAALLMWKHRRGMAERRIAKGLRSYSVRPQVIS